MRTRKPIVSTRRDGREWCWTALSPQTLAPVAEGVAPSRDEAIRTAQSSWRPSDKLLLLVSATCVAGIVAIRRWA